MSDHSIEETSILFVQGSCGVNRERAVELLEAGSASVERAVEIHFSALGTKRKQYPTAKSPSKQATLSSFFGSKNGKQATSGGGGGSSTNAIISGAPTGNKADEEITSPAMLEQPPRKKKATFPKPAVITDSRLHYGALATAFCEMVATTKRLAKLDSLKTALIGIVTALGGIGDDTDRTNDGDVLCKALELVLGAGNIKLQVSGSAVSKAVIAVTGATSAKLREAYRKTGDLGDAAEQFMRNQRLLVEPQPLTITGVHDVLQVIAKQEGKGSQNQRNQQMVKLLRSCKSHEVKFLVRTLLGNMRLGANVRTVLAALAMAMEEMDAARTGRAADTPTAVKTVQDTFDFCPRLDKLSYALLCGGVPRMKETCVMEVGTPINPMLANPAHSLEQVKKLMTLPDGTSSRAAVAEWKYDGMRCQAHFDGSNMKLYSRHLLETSDQFPEASKAILKARKETTSSFIIDSEIVGVEESADEPGIFRLLPFQDLSTSRGADSTIRICVYVFDVMYLNSESLAKKPLWRRQEMLREHFCETNDFLFAQSKSLESYDENVLSSFLETAVKGGAEGLMVKLTGFNVDEDAKLPANSSCDNISVCPYESGVRSQTWLKVKRDYVAGFADTVDVVPIGAWYGNGRKAQKKFLSPVLLAVYDEEEDVYRSISRCMSFTDAMYDAMRDFYLKGIPYPEGVGIAADEKLTAKEEANKGTPSNEPMNMSSIPEELQAEDKDTISIDEADAATEGEEAFVNCYPSRPSALVVTNESPPIWFKPMEVFEVSFADLSLSKTHTAAVGLVDAERGVALRFPRFKRRRLDKRIDQATTSAQIAELFAKQTKQSKS